MLKADFVADLRQKVNENCETVTAVFQPLTLDQLQWQPDAKEWNILQCFEHLNLTHDYYTPKIETAIANPKPLQTPDEYKPAFFGRLYMHFAFNPKYSFSTAAEMVPDTAVDPTVFTTYLAKQEALLDFLEQVAHVNLKTKVPISTAVNFHLGDCLKILPYHDALHIDQAQRVLAALSASNG